MGNVLSSDVFYNDDPSVNNSWSRMGVMAVKMEAAALSISPEERQTGFSKMMELALNTAAGAE